MSRLGFGTFKSRSRLDVLLGLGLVTLMSRLVSDWKILAETPRVLSSEVIVSRKNFELLRLHLIVQLLDKALKELTTNQTKCRGIEG